MPQVFQLVELTPTYHPGMPQSAAGFAFGDTCQPDMPQFAAGIAFDKTYRAGMPQNAAGMREVCRREGPHFLG